MDEEEYAARVVAKRPAPKYLYKYRSLAAASKDYARDLIVNERLYFPRPAELNDPFECRPRLESAATAEQQRKYISGLVKRTHTGTPRAERKRIVSDIRANRPHFRKTMMMATSDVLQAVGIYSLSARPLDLLMWPHYADNHRGVCVRFDMEVLMTNPKLVPFPVEYAEQRPTCDTMLEPTVDWLDKAVLTKGRPWAYEEEWRIVRNRDGGKMVQLAKSAISGVLLGANISVADRELVLQWAEEAGRPMAVGQAKFHPTAYELQVESLTGCIL